ncbi:hypothetical protein STSP2_01069 [Anaerohalosphaera lusitana]|uniref:Uncharacterized protein n=1 Tax=Anaerohalosphaera lusitana TaxID=1936003 RepID=A0A1U9NJD9_9BACT|nr:hypothetical protein [Anaerohalosphaera lusitana]AQT67917.1 hypothetical protein STSP2_01069 [Anaerohalosphaera lusitana]
MMKATGIKGNVDWNQRYQRALDRYEQIGAICPGLFTALTEELENWSDTLPQSHFAEGVYKPVNHWGLGAEQNEIRAITNELVLRGHDRLAACLQECFNSLRDSASALDEIYPKLDDEDEQAETRLVRQCRREAAHLSALLQRLRKKTFTANLKECPYSPAQLRDEIVKEDLGKSRPSEPGIAMSAGTCWSDISICFTNGHTVSIRVGRKSHTCNFAQMGMINRHTGEPNRQWETLRIFAESGGLLSWKNSSASPRLKKQKQQLSKKLRKFFQIADEPIVWGKDEKCYRCQFMIGH